MKGKTRYVILGCLSIRNLSGYGMRKFVQEVIGHFWAESNGQIYPVLHQLVEEECIVCCDTDKVGKRDRYVYAITPKGRKELVAWLSPSSEWKKKDIQRDEGLLKLFFGGNASVEESIILLEEREKQTHARIALYKNLRKEIESHKTSPHFLFWELTLENGMVHAEAEREWCSHALNKLKMTKEE